MTNERKAEVGMAVGAAMVIGGLTVAGVPWNVAVGGALAAWGAVVFWAWGSRL